MLRVDFVNPFLKAAYQVLEVEVGAKARKGELSTEDSYFTSKDITVIIGVVGEAQGMVLFGMSERTAKTLVSAMTGSKMPIVDRMVESAIAEMGNVITGLASTELEKAGIMCKLSPPVVITGRGTIISTVNIKRLVIPVITEYGEIEIGVALRENKLHPPLRAGDPRPLGLLKN